MSAFRDISPNDFSTNIFRSIGHEWMLVAARRGERVNMLTASWGGLGILWGKPVAYVFLRPQRYTRELVDDADTFSLSFFEEAYRPQLNLCGAKSGRDIDKVAECGFSVETALETPYFTQAHTAIICRKLYRSQLDESSFFDPSISDAMYPGKDFHYVYVGEVLQVLQK